MNRPSIPLIALVWITAPLWLPLGLAAALFGRNHGPHGYRL